MDMQRFIPMWLNVGTLEALGGHYEGHVERVVEEQIRNRFTAEKAPQPVIVFRDGKRLAPNVGQLRTLVTVLGPESDAWAGARLLVFLQRTTQTNPKTGRTREVVQKVVRVWGEDE